MTKPKAGEIMFTNFNIFKNKMALKDYCTIELFHMIHILKERINLWDRIDYFMEAEKQVSCKENYKEVSSGPFFLIKAVHDAFEKVRRRRESFSNILESPNFDRFYLLSKIHKDIPERPVISNCGF